MKTFLGLLTEEARYYLFEAPAPPGAQLFHKDIGFPSVDNIGPQPGMALSYGPHSKNAARDENLTRLPAQLPREFTIIEIEMYQGRPSKWVLRTPMRDDNYRDLVLVVGKDGFVVTLWTNDKRDLHKTLKKHLYTHPKEYRPTA
jgi:hypothetical protein